MKIILEDSDCKDNLYPFAVTRAVADIRIGISTIREKWAMLLAENPTISNVTSLTIPANLIPTKDNILFIIEQLSAGKKIPQSADIKYLKYPWHIFELNDWAIRKDMELVTAGRVSMPISTTNTVINPQQVFIEAGAVVEHCIINASTGPVYIGKNALVMEGTMIRGPLALCASATIKMGSKIYGATTIGPNCVAAGEIKNSVFFANSNKGHDGYLGDSVIGEWCNLGGGTSVSNLKNTAGSLKVWNNATKTNIDVGLKCGLLMGDYSRSAINSSFNTGTVVGICCSIFETGFPPKTIPDFSWGSQKYQWHKVMEHIDNWKKLKGESLTDTETTLLEKLYHQ